jgi:hypothetical protein
MVEESEPQNDEADHIIPDWSLKQKASELAKLVALGIWLVLLLPWLYVAPLSFMAFDAGDSLHARFFVLSVCTYPIAVAIVLALRKARPWLLLLPCINLVGMFVSGSYK